MIVIPRLLNLIVLCASRHLPGLALVVILAPLAQFVSVVDVRSAKRSNVGVLLDGRGQHLVVAVIPGADCLLGLLRRVGQLVARDGGHDLIRVFAPSIPNRGSAPADISIS